MARHEPFILKYPMNTYLTRERFREPGLEKSGA
jgi:hypothetical protein